MSFYTIIDLSTFKTKMNNQTNAIATSNTNDDHVVNLSTVFDKDGTGGTAQNIQTYSTTGDKCFNIWDVANNTYSGIELKGENIDQAVVEDSGTSDYRATDQGSQQTFEIAKSYIKSNNTTGFCMINNLSSQETYQQRDIGNIQMMTRSKGNIISGDKNIMVNRGSCYAFLRGSTGGGGGAGGGRQSSYWGYSRKNGGAGGDGGSTPNGFLLFPNVNDSTTNIQSTTSQVGGGGGGGQGGHTDGQYKGHGGHGGGTGGTTTFKINDEDFYIYSSGGGGGGGGARVGHNGGSGGQGYDIYYNQYWRPDNYVKNNIDQFSYCATTHITGEAEGGTGSKNNGTNGHSGIGGAIIVRGLLGSKGFHTS